jgi:hypothetical protein
MSRNCRACHAKFIVLAEDQHFYCKMSVPEPSRCPQCRQQRRAAFRNSRNLYRRSCSASGKTIISVYSPEKPYRVYDSAIWWGDSWDALAYGRQFDFSRTFFEQFAELMLEVPRPALFNKGSENSVYTNHAVYNKNCYMCFNAGYCEDTLYSEDVVVKCKDCCDLTNVMESELLYGCVDCLRCLHSKYMIQCQNCSDSAFLFDCRNCNCCFLCYNLRNKSYCIENKQYSKGEYLAKLAELDRGSLSENHASRQKFEALVDEEAVHRALITSQSENATGNYIFQSKNIFSSFDVQTSEDLRYCYDAWDIRDCMDTFQTMDGAELGYETHASSVSVDAKFCNVSHENHDVQYTDLCFNSSQLFGCVGLQRQDYCIFNRKYTKSDFEQLAARIVEHMKATGEYGEFFPVLLSPFGYNETAAQEYFPLERREAAASGFKWFDDQSPDSQLSSLTGPARLPDRIRDVEDGIVGQTLLCSRSGLPFRINQKELEIYRKLNIPLPRLHPNERHLDRLRWRNPRALAKHACTKCGTQVVSTFEKHRPANILCEDCYLLHIH